MSIFINYRREDSKEFSLGLSEDLKKKYGNEKVFIDVDDMGPGHWKEIIEKKILSSKIFLVVIGKEWHRIRNEETGIRRLDEKDDILRKEIELALKHKKMIIIVLASGREQLPPKEAFPESIIQLIETQYVLIRADNSQTRKSYIEILFGYIDEGFKSEILPIDDEILLLKNSVETFIAHKHDLTQYSAELVRILKLVIKSTSRKLDKNSLLRTIDSHAGIIIAYNLLLLKNRWNVDLAKRVRDLAIVGAQQTVQFSPYHDVQINKELSKHMKLARDKDLKEAYIQAVIFAWLAARTPVRFLRQLIPMAYRHTIDMVNADKVLQMKISTSIGDTKESEFLDILIELENVLRNKLQDIPK